MEKQSKPRSNNILKFLPRAASAIYFQNVPFSPNKDHRKPPHGGTTKGFSGPIISIIPDEARRKPRNNDGFGTQEPTSPKISCMGQIKHKKNVVNSKPVAANRTKNKRVPVIPPAEKPVFFTPREGKNKDSSGRPSAIKRMFSMSKTAARKSSSDEKAAESYGAPVLGQLKRFSSGREALSGFDWTAEIREESCGGRRNCYSDDEAEEEEEVILIPTSRPATVSCLQARSEVNLWKRRTITPPPPLQINPQA